MVVDFLGFADSDVVGGCTVFGCGFGLSSGGGDFFDN